MHMLFAGSCRLRSGRTNLRRAVVEREPEQLAQLFTDPNSCNLPEWMIMKNLFELVMLL